MSTMNPFEGAVAHAALGSAASNIAFCITRTESENARLAMAELSGSLASFSLSSIIELLVSLKKTARVHVAQEPWTGEVFLRHGQVVAAAFGMPRGLGGRPSDGLRGLAALQAIVLTPSGSFFVAEDDAAPEHNIALSAEELRAHLVALDNERAMYRSVWLAWDAVPRRIDAAEQPSADETLIIDRGKLNLLVAIDGRQTVAELVGAQSLLRTLRDLRWLMDQRLITAADPGAAAESSYRSHSGIAQLEPGAGRPERPLTTVSTGTQQLSHW
jgi:hypothetical protein